MTLALVAHVAGGPCGCCLSRVLALPIGQLAASPAAGDGVGPRRDEPPAAHGAWAPLVLYAASDVVRLAR
jgi:hypothetical protein